ncbi:MAG TPA: hypothetical protein VIL35_14165 [Vicinamibacterales bacterium]
MHIELPELVLLHSGELRDPALEAHVTQCAACRAELEAVVRVLSTFDARHTPDPGPEYGAAVWQAIAPRLDTAPRRFSFWRLPAVASWWVPQAAFASAVALLLVIGFANLPDGTLQPEEGRATTATAAPDGARDQILMAAVNDHLERASLMLTELNNAEEPDEVQEALYSADDLASANRLYRQAAVLAGDRRTAALLEDLERMLVEVAHTRAPQDSDPIDPDDLRARLDTREAAQRLQLVKLTLGN